MFRILLVCTANICRSPSAAELLRNELQHLGLDDDVGVDSAGVAAVEGKPACELSSSLVNQLLAHRDAGDPALESLLAGHVSQLVATSLVTEADLVLALDRGHRAELARLSPTARPKTFTLRQAASLARVVGAYLAAGELPVGAPPMPVDAVPRLRWWVGELDAARGLIPQPSHTTEATQDDSASWHPDDVPDPHVMGSEIHGAAIALIDQQVQAIAAGISQVLTFDGAE